MTQSAYITLMSFLEKSKHCIGQTSRWKLIRGFLFLTYRTVTFLENVLIKKAPVPARLSQQKREGLPYITASLTSYPGRINTAHLAIKSIMLQTLPPNRVVLWLAESQFPDHRLPENLLAYCPLGLEIRYCDEDLSSHKKYFYALQEQRPDEVVITFDEDIIYHPHTIERLLAEHQNHPDCIIASEALRVTKSENGTVNPYAKWLPQQDHCNNPDNQLTPLSGSGCLFPYHSLPAETFNVERIRQLSLNTCDLWIRLMSRMSDTKICTPDIVARVFSTVSSSQSNHLADYNCQKGGYEKTIQKYQQHFPNIF